MGDLVREMLDADPVQIAEDAGMSDLGLLAAVGFHGEVKRLTMKLTRDSYTGMSPAEFMALLAELNFKKIYEEDIPKTDRDDEEGNKLRCYWNRKLGMLVRLDTYWGHVNSACCYFVYTPKHNNGRFDLEGLHQVSGGPYGRPRAEYSRDIREGFRWWLSLARKHGWFSRKWGAKHKSRHLWLLSYAEDRQDLEKPKDWYREVNKAKIAKFPSAVQRAIGYAPEPWSW